ncbi:vesicle-associated membrane protein-associated protein A-like isoform X1 [Alosa sapidissima]|uniref:vesicle-associated membrane protein-associated protein A-like isoform X1 n=1 Tax=Alosa sapidissima TaxID=34773 RepID=UPI001C08C0D6|nr:vesicle-associated membrane protein-associated protein A-like isoform X1 [Alosa sapidissima]
MSKLEQILILDPPTDLRFKGPFTDVVTTNLRLKNPSDRRVCFKVKTTAPRRYCVRPNSGVIDAGATVTISVMLQPFDYDPNEKSKHKFMVQTIYVPSSGTDMEAMWRDVRPEDLMDSKLRCVFDMPTENDKVCVAGECSGAAAASASWPCMTPGAFSTPLSASVSGRPPYSTPASSAAGVRRLGQRSEVMQLRRQHEVDLAKPAPVLNSSRVDGLRGSTMDDTEMRKLLEDCKRLQAEMSKLADENRLLRDDGVRMRKPMWSDNVMSNASALIGRESAVSSLPSLLVVIAAIFIGFFLGKFVL